MKKLIAILCISVILLNFGSAFAVEPEQLISEACFYSGTLYYCDAERNKIVLKDVEPIGKINEKNTRTANEADYSEIWVSGRAELMDGSEVPLGECNRYVDSRVRVLITRSAADDLWVINIKFL